MIYKRFCRQDSLHTSMYGMISMAHRYGYLIDKYGYIKQVIDFDDNINDINSIINCTV